MSATAEFFRKLASRGFDPALESVTGTLRFDLADGGEVEHWSVAVNKGVVEVSEDCESPDCTLRTDKRLFDKIVRGRANAMAATLRGALVVQGDPELALAFQRCFPGPPTPRRPKPLTGVAAR